jgi:hypothetical protein
MIDPSVADLVIDAAWKSVLVAGAVLLLLAALKRRSAAERACVAHFGMAAVLLLPLAIVAGPSLELLPGREAEPVVLMTTGMDMGSEAPTISLVPQPIVAADEFLPVEPPAPGSLVSWASSSIFCLLPCCCWLPWWRSCACSRCGGGRT